jgi:rubrerythrin
MDTQKKQLLDGLLQAIQAERDGHSFYQMAATSTKDPKARDIFARLASEELDHLEFLTKQHASVLKTGRPDRAVKFGPRNNLSGMSPIFSDDIKMRIGGAHVEMSALSIGIKLELDAMSFYKAQAAAANDEVARGFFKELAEWEAGHYRALLMQQDELKKDYWAAGGFSPF